MSFEIFWDRILEKFNFGWNPEHMSVQSTSNTLFRTPNTKIQTHKTFLSFSVLFQSQTIVHSFFHIFVAQNSYDF